MKSSEVKIGGVYLTKVSGELVEVVVMNITFGTPPRYLLRRKGSVRMLPKLRSARALRPVEVSS